jgi:hypothetical protein
MSTHPLVPKDGNVYGSGSGSDGLQPVQQQTIKLALVVESSLSLDIS